MSTIEKAYRDGMTQAFESAGFRKTAAVKLVESYTDLEKKASLFNFSDSRSDDGISISSILIPLLAASLSGYVSYNARDKGSGKYSAFTNIKNYLGDKVNRLVRRSKPRPFYDISSYIDG